MTSTHPQSRRIGLPFRALAFLLGATLLAAGVGFGTLALVSLVEFGASAGWVETGALLFAAAAFMGGAAFVLHAAWTGRDLLEDRAQRRRRAAEADGDLIYPAIRGSQVSEARLADGTTLSEVATLADVDLAVLEMWERLDFEIPPDARPGVIWALWVSRTRARGDAAGLDRCDWVDEAVALRRRPDPVELDEHVTSCDRCRARLEAATDPLTGWRAAFGGVLPSILAAIVGPALVIGMGLVSFLFRALRGDGAAAAAFVVVLLSLVLGGTFTGLAHHRLRGLRASGPIGARMGWVLASAAYLTGVLLACAITSRIGPLRAYTPGMDEFARGVMTLGGFGVFVVASMVAGLILESLARSQNGATRHASSSDE
ncbi:MAG TPA: hypothetical protein VF039_04790, partial [Longimicrobiales bacterium]